MNSPLNSLKMNLGEKWKLERWKSSIIRVGIIGAGKLGVEYAEAFHSHNEKVDDEDYDISEEKYEQLLPAENLAPHIPFMISPCRQTDDNSESRRKLRELAGKGVEVVDIEEIFRKNPEVVFITAGPHPDADIKKEKGLENTRYAYLDASFPPIQEIAKVMNDSRKVFTGLAAIISNPAEPLALYIHAKYGLDPRRITSFPGAGLRWRSELHLRYSQYMVDWFNVSVPIIGEHGNAVYWKDKIVSQPAEDKSPWANPIYFHEMFPKAASQYTQEMADEHCRTIAQELRKVAIEEGGPYHFTTTRQGIIHISRRMFNTKFFNDPVACYFTIDEILDLAPRADKKTAKETVKYGGYALSPAYLRGGKIYRDKELNLSELSAANRSKLVRQFIGQNVWVEEKLREERV